jgi:DnaJ-class molecular chaperone with C-terminal Zn finger domain
MNVGKSKKEIYITFRVEKSDIFERDGPDIHSNAEISLSQAVLGGTIRIPGIYDDQTVLVGIPPLHYTSRGFLNLRFKSWTLLWPNSSPPS